MLPSVTPQNNIQRDLLKMVSRNIAEKKGTHDSNQSNGGEMLRL